MNKLVHYKSIRKNCTRQNYKKSCRRKNKTNELLYTIDYRIQNYKERTVHYKISCTVELAGKNVHIRTVTEFYTIEKRMCNNTINIAYVLSNTLVNFTKKYHLFVLGVERYCKSTCTTTHPCRHWTGTKSRRLKYISLYELML